MTGESVSIKRHPRTLQEAFGPHTSREVHAPSPGSSVLARWGYGILVAVSLASAAVMLSGCSPYDSSPGKKDGNGATLSCVKVG
jgi:hypothetical protein